MSLAGLLAFWPAGAFLVIDDHIHLDKSFRMLPTLKSLFLKNRMKLLVISYLKSTQVPNSALNRSDEIVKERRITEFNRETEAA